MNKPVLSADNQKKVVDKLATSLGNIRRPEYPSAKTDGIKIRGTGAATKGVKARGPMA